MDKVKNRLDTMDDRFDSVDNRLESIDTKLTRKTDISSVEKLERRVTRLEH